MATTAVAAPDRLSELSDDLLIHILSFVPVHEAASTTTLSRRWRRPLWLETGTVNLDYRSYTIDGGGGLLWTRILDDIKNARLAFIRSSGRDPIKFTLVMHGGGTFYDTTRDDRTLDATCSPEEEEEDDCTASIDEEDNTSGTEQEEGDESSYIDEEEEDDESSSIDEAEEDDSSSTEEDDSSDIDDDDEEEEETEEDDSSDIDDDDDDDDDEEEVDKEETEEDDSSDIDDDEEEEEEEKEEDSDTEEEDTEEEEEEEASAAGVLPEYLADAEEIRLECLDYWRWWPRCTLSSSPGSVPFAALRILEITGYTLQPYSERRRLLAVPCLEAMRLRRCRMTLPTLQDIISAAPKLADIHLESVRFVDAELKYRYRIRCPAATVIVMDNCNLENLYFSDECSIALDAPRLRLLRYRVVTYQDPFCSFESPMKHQEEIHL